VTAATSAAAAAPPRWRAIPLRAGWLLGGLAAATLARGAANGASSANQALLAGTGFGIALLGIALVAGWPPARPSPRALAIGTFGGAILVLLPLLLHPVALNVPGMRPTPFPEWAAVTLLVASAEEVLLRGALFSAVGRSYGLPAAVVVSSIAFALMHVPLYGWAVVPLDLAAGVWLAGLRMAGGGVGAPAVAHALADLATWFI
jgi:membrane protease YdiL (CAAX protease family)